MEKNDTSLVRICGFWVTTSKSGRKYLRGRLGGATALLFKNGFKAGDNHPDFILYVAPGSTSKETEEEASENSSKTIDESLPF